MNSREGSSNDDLGAWLKIIVTVDGINPLIRRELIVSPDITMQNLHYQVLCPAIGWTSNYHCYAFSRINDGLDYNCVTSEKPRGDTFETMRDSIEMMSEECWIGPKTSTALDRMFQPLYIGGALANDKKFTLGDIFALNEQGQMNLQYVHDFGDWWSHTICVSNFDGVAPSNASVSHLLSGEGGCPHTGGISNYALKISQLTWKVDLAKDDNIEEGIGESVDPTSERWWNLLNVEVRGKLNATLASPLAFDSGQERHKLTNHDYKTGLVSENVQKCSISPETQKDPTKCCAICGVTVVLKACSGCISIAFCSREHQLQYWPKHKKDCERIQSQRRGN